LYFRGAAAGMFRLSGFYKTALSFKSLEPQGIGKGQATAQE
jgi:hypothetical protein